MNLKYSDEGSNFVAEWTADRLDSKPQGMAKLPNVPVAASAARGIEIQKQALGILIEKTHDEWPGENRIPCRLSLTAAASCPTPL